MQKQTFKLFWQFARKYPVWLAFVLITPIIATLLTGYISPLILSQFLNQLQHGTVTLANSGNLVALYVASEIMGQIIAWRVALFAIWRFDLHVMRDIYHTIFNKLTSESLDFHANRFGGSLVSQTNKFVHASETLWDSMVWNVIPMITAITATIVILSFFYWQYAAFIFALCIVFTIGAAISTKLLVPRNTLEAQTDTKITANIADMITNMTTVKAFGRERPEVERTIGAVDDWAKASRSLMRGVLGATTGYSSLIVIINAGSLLFAITASGTLGISVGTAYLMLTYTMLVGEQLWQMNGIMRTYSRIVGDAHDMTAILTTPNALQDKSDSPLAVTAGEIAFNGVSFTHDNGKGTKVFKGFDLNIKPGERIGLVGHSGSGKSTLVRLLLRFSDIQSGTITIDGQNINEVTQQSLHESIAYVPQEPLLFHRSLAENIAYGNPTATRRQIIAAAKKANAWEFIKNLPDGLETLVGERGIKLSGGQRQRIAIARAILKKAKVIVLDEATSALDSESEKLIQEALAKLMNASTSIVIAHRLSTIAKLDRIVVLKNGKVAEQGTHAELLTAGGEYAKLWRHQSGGFLEE